MRFYVGNSSNVKFQINNSDIYFGRVAICNNGVKSNTIDTNTDTDLIISRNTSEALRVRASDNLILTSDTSYFSSPKVYSNELLNRTSSYDTVFYGANSTSDGRVEYMRWNRTGQSLDFNCPIDNTGLDVIGNLVNTGVSDYRLKTNIQNIDANYSDCVKHAKLKTFEFKDEKYNSQDEYGMIAQELLEHLPKEFKSIIREKPKNKEEKNI